MKQERIQPHKLFYCMEIPARLRCVTYDVKELHTDTTKLEFFRPVDSDFVDTSTSLVEATLVKWLMQNSAVRDLVFTELSISTSAKFNTEIRDPFIVNSNRKPGDIDLLVCEINSPNRAIAIEFKKVKARVVGGAEKINKLENSGNACGQVKGLHKVGFSQTYYGVIVIVDGREYTEQNFFSRSISDKNYRRIVEFTGGLGLSEEVGVLYIEVVQPVQSSIDDAAMVCVGVLKAARMRAQSADLTTLVENYFQNQ